MEQASDHKLRIEWLILADYAQVLGGKLFLAGGGWDKLHVAKFPTSQPVGIALSFRVPWTETNVKHSFQLEIQSIDGEKSMRADGQFEVGRPPGAVPGNDQRTQIAVGLQMDFKKPGEFVVIANIQGDSVRFPFSVAPAAPQLAQVQGSAGNQG